MATAVVAVSNWGTAGLQHGLCGRVSNRGYGAEFRAAVLERVGARYADFGPTLAAEHLVSDDGFALARETLRRWLRAADRPAVRRRSAYRKRREPKAHFGELVQMDGSFHKWLEERAGQGCLMHMVDDATSTALFSNTPSSKHPWKHAFNPMQAPLPPRSPTATQGDISIEVNMGTFLLRYDRASGVR